MTSTSLLLFHLRVFPYWSPISLEAPFPSRIGLLAAEGRCHQRKWLSLNDNSPPVVFRFCLLAEASTLGTTLCPAHHNVLPLQSYCVDILHTSLFPVISYCFTSSWASHLQAAHSPPAPPPHRSFHMSFYFEIWVWWFSPVIPAPQWGKAGWPQIQSLPSWQIEFKASLDKLVITCVKINQLIINQ